MQSIAYTSPSAQREVQSCSRNQVESDATMRPSKTKACPYLWRAFKKALVELQSWIESQLFVLLPLDRRLERQYCREPRDPIHRDDRIEQRLTKRYGRVQDR